MTFITYLHKDNWTIRVNSDPNGAYLLEYSNDGFKTKQVRTYKSKAALLEALKIRFSAEELEGVKND